MNVSTSSSSHAPFDSKPIRDLFDGVRSEHSKLNEYFDQTFDELETLRASLDEYQIDLKNQHSDVERVREELDGVSRSESDQLEAIKAELDTARTELEQLRQHNVEELTADGEVARYEIEELCAERDSLRSELESVRGQIDELEPAGEEPDQIRTALDEVQQEVTSQRDQIAEFKQERDVLEKELESVRGRACELTDAMDRAKREMAEERAQWTVELNKMRQLLERQMELNTSLRPTAVGPTAVGAIADVPVDAIEERLSDEAPPEAAVVGTVMAQFDNIRRQRALRREKKQKDSA